MLGLCIFGLGGQKRLPVGDRNLIVVRMNFRESKETMAVSAILYESGLKRRFYPRDPGEIDISFELLFVL